MTKKITFLARRSGEFIGIYDHLKMQDPLKISIIIVADPLDKTVLRSPIFESSNIPIRILNAPLIYPYNDVLFIL